MSLTNDMFIIDGIEQHVTAEYIATVLINHNIVKVKNIKLIPYFSKKYVYIRAYVELWSWCESEVAEKIIEQLNDSTLETQIQHHNNEYWTFKITEYDSDFPFQLHGCISENFPLTFYDNCLNIETAEKRLQKAHRDLIFATEFGDDYDVQVEAEFEYNNALELFKELHCKITFKSACIGDRHIKHRAHMKKY